MTSSSRLKVKSIIAAVTLALGAPAAGAARLDREGFGQALIYPYYTVRGSEGGQFNTYFSVSNHSRRAKAVRVRVRESRLGKPVADFNVYLSPNDLWTGAIVPTETGAKIISTDVSCIEPDVRSEPGSPTREIVFHDANFSGPNADDAATGLDRTREGYIEMLEMGTLTGTTASGVTHTSQGVPSNCGVILAMEPQVEAPAGGLSGSLTLIDVVRGLQFDARAEALDQLASRPYFRRPDDPYASFAAAEIDPRSTIVHEGHAYHSVWSTGLEAVSAVLMVSELSGEYVLDQVSASRTEVVMAIPTRPYHATASTFSEPFTTRLGWASQCNAFGATSIAEGFYAEYSNREEGLAPGESGCTFGVCRSDGICAVSAVGTLESQLAPQRSGMAAVLGSISGGLFWQPLRTLWNGRLRLDFESSSTRPRWLTSRPGSRRVDIATGAVLEAPHRVIGLPAVGFVVQTYRNGAKHFGAALPLQARRSISVVP
jgi:hypothetical protein